MRTNKKGISLIVLVITIIVMIILAGAVIVSLGNAGIIDRANEAVGKTNLNQVKQLASLAWSEAYIDIMEEELTEAERVAKLEAAVDEALEENEVNKDLYDIDVTTSGVTVKLKGEVDGWVQTGHTVTDGTTTLTVGDYIDYKANVSGYTDTNGWRVLGAENGELLIVSAGEVVDSLTLGGSTLAEAQASYAGGALTALQTAVDAYGEGDKATGVRSIKGEDIDRIAEYDVTTFTGPGYVDMYVEATGASQSDVLSMLGVSDISQMNIMNYGTTVTFSWDETNYPVYSYEYENETVTGSLAGSHSTMFTWYDESAKTWRTSSKATSGAIKDNTVTTATASITNNMAGYLGTELGTSTAAYEMLIANADGNLEYWLASPVSFMNETDCAIFGLRLVGGGGVIAYSFVYSNGGYGSNDLGVRAVVSLESDIQLDPNGANAWTIAN